MLKYYYSDLNEENVFENDECQIMVEEIVSNFLLSKENHDYDLVIEYIHDHDSSRNMTFVFENMEANYGYFREEEEEEMYDELFDILNNAIDLPVYYIKLNDDTYESKYYVTDFYICNVVTQEEEHFHFAPNVTCKDLSMDYMERNSDMLRIYKDNNIKKYTHIPKYKYYTKKEIDDLKSKYGYKREELETNNLVIVDTEIINKGIMFYFGTREQFLDSWGDDWNDVPYECNAGPVYDKYTTYKWYYIPNNDVISIIPIEEYFHHYGSPYSKAMFKRRVISPIILSIGYDRRCALDFPIHFGMSDYELKNLINKLEG